jgi:hypothetical protein
MSKGIDIPIDNQVTAFTTYLWTGLTRSFYGRVMRNYRNGKIVPERFSGTNYTDVLLDDTQGAMCFFDVEPRRTPTEATVNIYFAVNLTAAYSAVSERATEYALSDVLLLLKQSGYFTVEEIVEGYESWSQWEGVKREDNMQPFYLFCIKTNCNYLITC